MKLNKEAQVVVWTIVGGFVGLTVWEYVRTMRKVNKEIHKIEADEAATIAAIRVATARVEERLNSGKYSGPDAIARIMVDLRIEEIEELLKD